MAGTLDHMLPFGVVPSVTSTGSNEIFLPPGPFGKQAAKQASKQAAKQAAKQATRVRSDRCEGWQKNRKDRQRNTRRKGGS